MMEKDKVVSGHSDVVQDLSYDYFGERLATCSTDRQVKVWEADEERAGQWKCVASWNAHDSGVLRVIWADPEVGSVLATCSFDCKAIIWEERGARGGEWHMAATMGDSRDELNDIAFAPIRLGLMLATASSDCMLRIYEAIDPSDLQQWALVTEFYGGGNVDTPLTSLSWNFTPVTDVAALVVGARDHKARVWARNSLSRSWNLVAVLVGHRDAVLCVDWAANYTHDQHYIATGGADGQLLIYELPLTITRATNTQEIEPVASFAKHGGPVWRLRWNLSGNMLVSSGEDAAMLWERQWGKWCFAGEFGS